MALSSSKVVSLTNSTSGSLLVAELRVSMTLMQTATANTATIGEAASTWVAPTNIAPSTRPAHLTTPLLDGSPIDMTFYRLFLDDERVPKQVTWVDMPPGPWTIARDYDMFVDMIKRLGVPGFVSFDHDLGAEHYDVAREHYATERLLIDPKKTFSAHYQDGTLKKTGCHCARWLIEHCLEHGIPIPPYQVHSMNPIGVENIRSIMENGLRVQASQS